jgi:hypothetical protein
MSGITAWEFRVPIPEDAPQPRELAYQRDKATVMCWYKPEPIRYLEPVPASGGNQPAEG